MAQFWHRASAWCAGQVGNDDGHLSPEKEKALRRQLDQAIARALVDRDFADELVTDPAKALDTPALHDIHVGSLSSLARQFLDQFWVSTSG